MRAKIPAEQWRAQMTLEQEMYFIKKHAREDGYAEGYRVAVAEKEEALNEACERNKLENARKLKESAVSLEIISKCTGLSLEQVREL